jgi:hypothetical protein
MTEKSKPFPVVLEEFCREHIAPDLVQAAEPEPDRILVNRDGQIVIQAGHDEWVGRDAEPFVIGDKHNLYEWAMVLAERHPRSAFWYAGPGTGVDDETRKDIRIKAIGLWEQSQAIFEAIVAAHESGKIKPVPVAWYKKQPTDLTLLSFRRDDVLKVISELGADGVVISMLMAQRELQIGGETATSIVAAPTEANMAAKTAKVIGTRAVDLVDIVKPSAERESLPKRRPGPIATVERIREAGKALIAGGHVPGETIPWGRFREMICRRVGVPPETRGYGEDTIQNALRDVLKQRQLDILASESTESTES